MKHSTKQTVILAITGASGLHYGLRLLECLVRANKTVHFLISKAARAVAALEMGLSLPVQSSKLAAFLTERYHANKDQITVFENEEWTAPFASGSHTSNAMIICPCSSGTLAAIANGLSNNLIERAADVILKEKKQLILVPRETPLSVIHLENMLKLAKMNAVILPAMPGFYHQPKSIRELIDFIVARILDHLGIEHELVPRWSDSSL